MDNVLEVGGVWHVHSVDVCLATECHWQVDGWWQSDLRHLVELALMAGLNIPFNVAVEQWPPEAVGDGALCRVEALVAKAIMDEGEVKCWCDV